MLIQHLKKHFGFYSLTFIIFIIAIINYKPGTYLTGWDTIHPEFDFGLNFKRLINGVWRQEQGLGAVAGHSHMADLPRLVILWFLHIIFPISIVRYVYVFLCLWAGPIGIYFLIHHLLQPKLKKSRESVAFLSGFFYLFNLGTVQQFIVPFEMFTTQYALLPWIILSSLRYLKSPTRKNLLFFAVVTLFSIPQAYAAHLWYAFFAIYLCFITLYVLMEKNLEAVKKAFTLIALTILINSFWLLPNLYFIKTSSYIPVEAKQTRLFSEEYGLRNREHGYIQDVALIKGFYFNWSIFSFEKQRVEYLMKDWRDHYDNQIVNYIGYAFFAVAALGMIFSLKKRDRVYFTFIPFLFVSLIFLLNHTFPFDRFFDFLVKFSLFDQALRFVFTKFSIFLTFSYTIYFSYFLYFVLSLHLAGHNYRKWLIYGMNIAIVSLLTIYALPILRGSLISEKVKVAIPDEYFQFWEYMKNQDEGVVLSLPLHTFSGWQYYDWGYQGSGFIWFGLKQPILDRDFDRWSIQNEQAYREFRYAQYARNPDKFIKNLDKFNITYIIWDRNNIATSLKNRPQIVYDRESEILMTDLVTSGKVYQIGAFGKLNVYKLISTNTSNIKSGSLPQVNPKYRWAYFDNAYDIFGSYFTPIKIEESMPKGYYFSYRDIYTFDDKLKKEYFSVLKNMQKANDVILLSPEEIIEQNPDSPGVRLVQKSSGKALSFISKNEAHGIGLNFYSLTHDKGYILGLMTKNLKGLPLRFCFRNLYSTLCDIYDEASKNKDFDYDYYFVPPTEGALGYDLSIDSLSYGDYDSVNELRSILLIPISSEFMKYFRTNIPIVNDQIYIYYQSYNPGWLAYRIKSDPSRLKTVVRSALPFLYGERLKDHVLVNNWANGWRISPELVTASQASSTSLTIIFWPQYLEYIGFVLLILSFLYILKQNKIS